MKRGFVVDCDFLARLNVAQSDEQNVAVENLHEGAGFAAMIDVVRAISASAPIKTPAIVNCADPQFSPLSPAIGLGICDLFTSVLSYLPAVPKVSN